MKLFLELFAFLFENKKLWMFPVVLIMLALSLFLVLGQTTAVAPLIYAIF
ncbi:MAG: DUF5989 family protein [Dehalococcoidia bacterium]|jgi:hypothetical protein|nr:DUF5989 family protein [Dehalococcoidia bacterium]|tara:strand:- start:1390 stop:1539 length:150 start_codon:yes stop_codon:yes gene_type:complete